MQGFAEGVVIGGALTDALAMLPHVLNQHR
jgi:hypothetical protein